MPLRRGGEASCWERTLRAVDRWRFLALPGLGGGAGRGRAAVVVLAADDVVLAQVGAVLDLDQDDGNAAGILDAVPRPARDIHRPARLEPPGASGDDHAR